MEQKEVIENNYNNKDKKIISIILIIGIFLGGILIFVGVIQHKKVNLHYTNEYIQQEKERLDGEKKSIVERLDEQEETILSWKKSFEDKIKPFEEEIAELKKVPFNGYNVEYYERNKRIRELENTISIEKLSINAIEKAVSDKFNHCVYEEMQANSYTMKYCEIKMELVAKENEINTVEYKYSDYNKQIDVKKYTSLYILGGLSIIISISIASLVYLLSKKKK